MSSSLVFFVNAFKNHSCVIAPQSCSITLVHFDTVPDKHKPFFAGNIGGERKRPSVFLLPYFI
jgi:hypothetical protein